MNLPFVLEIYGIICKKPPIFMIFLSADFFFNYSKKHPYRNTESQCQTVRPGAGNDLHVSLCSSVKAEFLRLLTVDT